MVLIREQALRQQALISTELADGLPPVLGVRVDLQPLVLNLTMNAIEATAEVSDRKRGSRSPRRASRSPRASVLVKVHDSGPGIDEQDLERVFEAFYATKPDGLGMGLAISRSIVEAHGGRLWASIDGAPGATFQFVLPGAS